MASLDVKGLKGLQARIEAIGKNTPKVVEIALTEEANVILADSVTNYVPKDTGTLANSGKVEPPVTNGNTVEVTLGFGGQAADYALDVHENPRSGVTEGWNPDRTRRYQHWARTGEWKYLETPLKEHAPDVAVALRTEIDAYLEEIARNKAAEGFVNVRPLPRRQPRPTGNDILEGP